MPSSEAEHRVRIIGEEIRRLGELYRIVYAVYEAQPQLLRTGRGMDWPRAECLIKPRAPTFANVALQYLEAVRPNCADVSQVTKYVRHWLGAGYSSSACSQSLSQLVRAGSAIRADRRGRWRASRPIDKDPQRDPSKLPEMNLSGIKDEVCRLILAYGPMQTRDIREQLEHFFSIGGEHPDGYLYTAISKSDQIRHCRGFGWVLNDMVHLEPALRGTLRRRRGDANFNSPANASEFKTTATISSNPIQVKPTSSGS